MASDPLTLGLSANRSAASDSHEDLLSQANTLLSQGKQDEARSLLLPYRGKSRAAARFLDQLDGEAKAKCAKLAETLLQSLGAQLTEAQRKELQSLGRSESGEEFFDGLSRFAQARQQADQLEVAVAIFGMLAEPGEHSAVPAAIRAKAQKEIQAINGEGALGQRLEFLGSRFVHDASDPRTIVPMLAGSLVYNVARASALGRFAMTAGDAWYTRGLGARVAATAIAFPLEVTVFSMGSRVLSGNKQWDPASVGKDWLGAALTLGTLKTFSALGNRTFAALHGVGAEGLATRFGSMASFNQFFLPQAASFAGMLAAHKLEQKFGLRPVVEDDTAVADTFVSLVSMSVGAHLAHGLLGSRFAAFEKELEIRVEQNSQLAERKTPAFLEKLRELGNEAALAPMWMAMGMGGLGGGSGLPRGAGKRLAKAKEKSSPASELRRSLKAHYADEPETAKEYEKHVQYLAGTEGGPQALEGIRERFASDPETASDLLAAYANLFRSMRGKGRVETVEAALALNREMPQAMLPALVLANEYQTEHPKKGRSPASILASILLLKDLRPATAEAAIEGMAGNFAMRRNENILEFLESVKQLEPASREALFQAWDPFLKEAMDPNGLDKGSVSHWPWLLENPLRAQEIATMIQACAEDRVLLEQISEFRDLWAEAGRDYRSFWDLSPELSRESASTVLVKVFSEHESWSDWVSARDAARMATDPRWIRELFEPDHKKMIGSSFAFQDLSCRPDWMGLFSRFIKRSQDIPGLRAPHHYAEWFAEISLNYEVHDEISWKEVWGKRELTQEHQSFQSLVEELRQEPTKASNPPPPVLEQAELARLRSMPYRPTQFEDKWRPSAENNQLLLSQMRYWLMLRASQGKSEEVLRYAKLFLESLNQLALRHPSFHSFQRSDFYLNVMKGMDLDPEQVPPFLPVLKLDLQELKDQAPLSRGLSMARWVTRLKAQGHPHWERAVAMILDEALTPLPNRNSFTSSAEEGVMETLVAFWTPQVEQLLQDHVQDPQIRNKSQKVQGMLSRLQRSLGYDLEDRTSLDMENIFYGGPKPNDLDGLETKDLLLPSARTASLGTGRTEGKEETGKVSETALAVVMSQGALATAKFEPNPETGLLAIDLGGGTKLSLWHAVAPVASEDAATSRADWSRRQDASLHDTHRELKQLDIEAERLDLSAMIPAPQSSEEQIQANLALAREVDTLTAIMRRSVGEDPEGTLLQQLAEAMSLRRGLDLMEIFLARNSRNNVAFKNLRDLSDTLPNVTSTDIVLTSLGEKAPRLLAAEEGLTMPYRLHVSGIEWANDTYDPAKQREGLFAVDPYQYGGITGASSGTEHSFFNRHVSKLLQSALKARLSDRKLFQEVWNRFPESAMTGLKMLKDWGDPKFLLNKEVYDLEEARNAAPSEVARLVGLLERVPLWARRAEAARLYFKPFGAGILFLNAEGKPMEYISYHPHLQMSGFQEIHYKTEADLSDDNAHAQQFLGDRLLGKIVDVSLEQAGDDLSRLEEKMSDFHLRYGVHLPLALRVAGAVKERKAPSVIPNMLATKSLKMGLEEVAALDQAFGMLPKHLLQRIVEGSEEGGGLRQIRKDLSKSMDFMDWSQEGRVLGYYTPGERSITLLHLQGMPYHQLNPLGRQIWSDTLLHELGEALYESLSPRERESFVSIYPWKAGVSDEGHAAQVPASYLVTLGETLLQGLGLTPALPEKQLPQHLLTNYSASNPRDQFCEAFASYIAHGPEFREKAKGSDYLKKYYALLRERIFTGPEGTVEYAAPVGATLGEIEGHIRRWRLEAELERRDLELEEAHEQAKHSEFGKYIKSTEEEFDRMRAAVARQNAQELNEAGMLGSYFARAELEEAGVKPPHRNQEATSFQPEGRDPQEIILERLVKELGFALPEAVAERIANRVPEFLSRGQRKRALSFLEWQVARMERNGIHLDANAEEILDMIIDSLDKSLVDRTVNWFPALEVLRRYLLVGQYSSEQLEALDGILRHPETKDSQKIRQVYDYLLQQKAWKLSAELVHRMTASLAYAYTSWGRQLKEPPLFALLDGLTAGKLGIHELEKQTKIRSTDIDTFAKSFLPSEQYEQLMARSERGNLAQQLQMSLAVQRSLEAQYRVLYTQDQPPQDLLASIERLQKILAALQGQATGAVDQAKQLLGDAQFQAKIDGLSRDLFRETQDRRDRQRRLPPKP